MILPNELAHLRNGVVRRLAGYWLDQRGGRPMPRLRDINPVALPWASPMLWVVDRLEAGVFRYRLAGSEIEQVIGAGAANRPLEDVFPPAVAARLAAIWESVASQAAIAHHLGPVYTDKERVLPGERIILPVADDGGAVTVLLGLTVRERSAAHPEELVPNAILPLTMTPVDVLPVELPEPPEQPKGAGTRRGYSRVAARLATSAAAG